MEKEFVPYEQGLALKELGFDESTYTWRQHGNGISGDVEGKRDYYNRKGDVYVALPLYQQAFRWFREKYCLNSFIVDSKSYDWYFNINDMQTDDVISEVLYFKKYEEAELECLKKLIEIVKNK